MMIQSLTPLPLTDEPGYVPLKSFIIETTGLAYYADKDDDLNHRIGKRLAESGRPDCAAYLDLLRDPRDGATELDRLVEELTVGETSFFRHAELFDGLREKVLPDLIARNRESRRLRIWSAGCSIGAEAYSVSILLRQAFAAQTDGWDITILGTDINREFLDRAGKGVFRSWDFRGASSPALQQCFECQGDRWALRAEYQRGVRFEHHNLMRCASETLAGKLGMFDLILCRNVLIYFSPQIMRQLVDDFRECIAEGGWLLVGHAEPNIEIFRAFRTVNVPGAVLYQKAAAPQVSRPVQAAMGKALGEEASPGRIRDACVSPLAPPSSRPQSAVMNRSSLGEALRDDLLSIKQLADAGDLGTALRRCTELTVEHPMNPDLHFCHAMLSEQHGLRRQAESSLRRTLYLNPQHVLAHYYAGVLHQKYGRRQLARRSYSNVQKLLVGRDDGDTVPEADGLVVRDLRAMAQMQQEALNER